jgi:ABC-2 type transport system permease protein/lipopolysaccharide transport system permease protein
MSASAAARSRRFTQLAISDLIDGVGKAPLWLALGWQDIRQRYRRSIIGPFWITATLGISILALGIVYSVLFHQPLQEYLPYVATGFLVWNMISALLTESCLVFIAAESTIKQLPFPLSTYVYRVLWRNLIVFGHNFIIYLIVALVFRINPGFGVLEIIPGLILILLNGLAWSLIFGVLSARFRDIPQLVANVLQVVYFITPILWKPSMLGKAAWIADFNPFTYLIGIVRNPLLGMPLPLLGWAFMIGMTSISLVVAIAIFCRFRWRIPYWL